MSESSKLVCLIAAGGTAGHVRPALAVAEALRERGVTVTFAGSPDRVESRLVPEAGFELDTFSVSGFPRRARDRARPRARGGPCARRSPASASSDAALRTSSSAAAGTSPGRWCWRRACEGVPAALTEADAHLGLANRLAAPLARRVFLAYDIPGRDGAKYRVVGRPIPRAHLGADRQASPRCASASRRTGPYSRCSAGSPAPRRSTSSPSTTYGESGPAVLHIAGERDFDGAAAEGRRGADYVLLADRASASATRSRLPISRSRARAARSGSSPPPGRRRSSFRIPHATADHQFSERRSLRAGRRGGRRARRRSSRASRRSWTSCSTIPSGCGG